MRDGFQLTIILLALLAGGCATSIKVADDFPEPLVEKLPLTVGIVFNEKLSTYVHVEDPMMDAEWSIDIGQANVDMFRALFTGMFTDVLELKLSEDGTPIIPAAPRLDAVIEPRLEDFEFSVPRQSGNDQFTVWIRYNIRTTTPENEAISNWRVTAYGQVDEGAMGLGDGAAMQEAAVIALRDAAANIATGFSKAPGVRKKLLIPSTLMFQEQKLESF
jgi:hypothetical protein